jgi:hypothetical protein
MGAVQVLQMSRPLQGVRSACPTRQGDYNTVKVVTFATFTHHHQATSQEALGARRRRRKSLIPAFVHTYSDDTLSPTRSAGMLAHSTT